MNNCNNLCIFSVISGMNNCNNLCIFSVISGIKIAAGHDVGLT